MTAAQRAPGPAALAALVIAAVLVTAAAHECSVGARESALADAAAAKGDWLEAIAHARAAAEAMAPGSASPAQGFRRLDAIGRAAEERGDANTALLAYGAMRTAAIATATPSGLLAWRANGGEWRVRADEGLVRVAATLARTASGGSGSGGPPGEAAAGRGAAAAMKSALGGAP
jgi:hypothetical protein